MPSKRASAGLPSAASVPRAWSKRSPIAAEHEQVRGLRLDCACQRQLGVGRGLVERMLVDLQLVGVRPHLPVRGDAVEVTDQDGRAQPCLHGVVETAVGGNDDGVGCDVRDVARREGTPADHYHHLRHRIPPLALPRSGSGRWRRPPSQPADPASSPFSVARSLAAQCGNCHVDGCLRMSGSM